MKIRIDRELLNAKLSSAAKFVPKKSVIPATDNFLFTVEDNVIFIEATDGQIAVEIQCPCSSDGNVAFCVPARLLLGLVSNFRENEVVITVKSEIAIELKCGKSKHNISLSCPANSFPIMRMGDVVSEIAMAQSLLSLGLLSAKKFVDEDNPNANYTGINISEVGNKIIFSGTTGHVMCRAALRPISIQQWTPIVIHAVTAVRVSDLLSDEGEVTVVHSGDKIRFLASGEGSWVVTSTVSNVKFPDTEKVFSRRSSNCVLVDRMELRDAVKRLMFYTELDTSSKVRMVANETDIILSAIDGFSGNTGEEPMSFIQMNSEIPLDRKHISDDIFNMLGVFEDKEVYIYFSDTKQMPTYLIPKPSNQEMDIFSFAMGVVS